MKEDIDKIMRVMALAFDPTWGEGWNRRQLSNSLTMPHIHYRLIDSSGNSPLAKYKAAGFTLTKYTAEEEELLLIAVEPEYRTKGLGTKLLQHCFEDAFKRGAKRILLEMRENNPARAMYEKLGFEPVGHRKDYYKGINSNCIDAVTFSKKLA